MQSKTESIEDSFEDIRIIGVDKSRTLRPDPEKQLYDVYFQLSANPSNNWIILFDQERRFPRHNMWRKAWVEGSFIVVRCALDEIEKYHLEDIKIDVEKTNKNYREELKRYEAKAKLDRQRREDEEKLKDNTLDSLNF
jgi:hypothetical protein